MITRPISGPHICLRCQRSLLKRSKPSAAQAAFQSTSPTIRRYPAPQDTSTDDKPSSRFTIRRSDGRAVAPELESGSGQAPVKLSEIPLGRLHAHRRGLLSTESQADLNATALGDPAKALVLRDSIFTLYSINPDLLDDKEADHIDILGQLEEERGLVGWAEVQRNIDAFKPNNDEVTTWDSIHELVRGLQSGFTISQLEKYIETFEGKRDPESPPAPWFTKEKQAPITKITPWQPGVSPIQEYFDNDPLRGYYLESHTSKQRMVLRLLRECWMLELPELVEGIGQFEMLVGGRELEVLLLSPASLNSINEEYLDEEGERLEVFRTRRAIRVTVAQSKKDRIVHAMEELLNTIRIGEISLRALISSSKTFIGKKDFHRLEKSVDKHFDDVTLQELAQMTDTSIAKHPKEKLIISSVGDYSDSLNSNVDIARRLVLTSGKFSERITRQLAYDSSKSNTATLVKYHSVEGLSWRDRLRQWMRWTTPIGKEKTTYRKRDRASTLGRETKLQTWTPAPSVPASESPPNSTGTKYWDRRTFTETSAIMGMVLHSSLDANRTHLLLTSKLGEPRWQNAISTFSTQVPNLSRVLSRGNVKERGTKIDYLILRLLPNPFFVPEMSTNVSPPQEGKENAKGNDTNQNTVDGKKVQVHPPTERRDETGAIGAVALWAFPPVEMRFSIDPDTKETRLRDIQAIVEEDQTDVMLPHNAVDVRFQQRTTTRLIRKYNPQIRRFLKKCQLSLTNKTRLDAPPTITLPISKHICRKPDFKLLNGNTTEGKETGENEVRQVPYLFAGLEIRSTLVLDYGQWRLLYTSIEAGRTGGRRAEVRIRPVKSGKVSTEKEFVHAAYRLAAALGSSEDFGPLPEFSGIRKIQKNDSQQYPLVRGKVTKEAKASEPLFKYFAKRLMDEEAVEEEWDDGVGVEEDFDDSGDVEDEVEQGKI